MQTLNTSELRQKVWQHILENAKKKDLFIDFVNGHAEHCYCLVSLSVDQTISKVMQLIKGGHACWFNKTGIDRKSIISIKHFNRNMMNLLLNMDLRNLLVNLAEANNKIFHLFLRLKPEAIHRANPSQ